MWHSICSVFVFLAIVASFSFFGNYRHAHAIDSVTQKKIEEAVQKDKKFLRPGETACVTLTSKERIGCVWLADVGDKYRCYTAADNKYLTIEKKDVLDVKGAVLTVTPRIAVSVEKTTFRCADCPDVVYINLWEDDTRAEVVPE